MVGEYWAAARLAHVHKPRKTFDVRNQKVEEQTGE